MDIIAGRFRVDRWLGEGNLGQLYLVEQIDTPFRNTLRVLPSGTAGGATPRTPLTDFVTRIQHQNLVQVDEVGQTADGLTYVVMDHSSGTLLTEVVARGGVPLRWAVEMVRQMIAGVRAAHESGTIHGALTPESVMIGSSEDDRLNVRILDLGLFTLFRERGCRPDPRYASVEVLTGRAPDELSDVFSLGAVAYHLMTGTPFGTPSQEPNQIPPALSAVLMTALAKEPGARFVSAAQLGEALEQAWSAPSFPRPTAARTPDAPPTPVAAPTPAATSTPEVNATPTVEPVAGTEPEPTMEPSSATSRPRTFEVVSTRPQIQTTPEPLPVPEPPEKESGRRRYELVGLALAAAVLLMVWVYRPATKSADLATPSRPLLVAREDSASPNELSRVSSKSKRASTSGVKSALRGVTRPTLLPGQGYKEPLPEDHVPPDSAAANNAAPADNRPISTPSIVSETLSASGAPTSSEVATSSDAVAPSVEPTTSAPVETEESRAEAAMAEARVAATSAVNAYASAIEANDVDAIGRLDPGLTEHERSTWQGFFAATRDVKAQLAVTDLKLKDGIAKVTVSGVYQFASCNLNHLERRPVSFQAMLIRGPDGWHLTQVR